MKEAILPRVHGLALKTTVAAVCYDLFDSLILIFFLITSISVKEREQMYRLISSYEIFYPIIL